MKRSGADRRGVATERRRSELRSEDITCKGIEQNKVALKREGEE